ncbi:hypothetical protein L1887_45020 [Cichorium endivia]|nr:hypothetical protein L1887_45020 [Cichorium endivia]
MRARTKVRAFFFYILRKGGDENSRPGFDNWRQPVGQTESAANRLPAGRAKRVNPPLTAIFKMRARGMRTPDRGSTTGDSQLDRLRAWRTGCPHKNAGSVFEQRLRWPQPMDTTAVASEIQRTWNREDAAQWAEVYTHIFPVYRLLIESYGKAREVVINSEALDSQR